MCECKGHIPEKHIVLVPVRESKRIYNICVRAQNRVRFYVNHWKYELHSERTGLLAGSSEDHLFFSLSPSSRSNFIRYSWIKLAWPEECAVKAFSQWKQKSLCHLLLRRQRYVKISTNKLVYRK